MTLKIEEDYDILKSILILVIPHKVFCKQLYSVKQGWLFPGFGPMHALHGKQVFSHQVTSLGRSLVEKF